jgi:hypothetical protein
LKGDGKVLFVMYRHMDGYLTGHGKELLDFLEGLEIVNGLSLANKGKIANTVFDLAAQMVHHFKEDSPDGGIYLYPTAGFKVSDEDYVYVIEAPEFPVTWTGPADDLSIKVYNWGKRLFSGTVGELRSEDLKKLGK